VSKFDVGWGFASPPRPHCWSSALPDPRAAFKGRGKGTVDGRGGEMRERDGSRRREKAEGRDEDISPTLKCRKIHSFSFF